MGRSQETFNKKEVRNKREKKRKAKERKREERREKDKNSLDDMIAYVDENGMISSTPPDPDKKEETKLEDIQIEPPNKNTAEDENPEKSGIVSFFNDEKGYGFIKESNSKQDVFVHINNLTEPIKEGNIVSFEIEKGPKGFIAVNVKLLK